jgi:hypothetical protein
MTAELIRELEQIQRYAAGLHDLLAQAQAQAPRQAEGADRSGTVRVVLGPDGFPETIRVENGWDRRLSAEAFGWAVGEAFSVATGDRLAEWTTTLRQHGWQAGVDRLRADVDGGRSAATPPALRREVRPVRPRPLDAVAEDVIRSFDALDEPAVPPAPASGTGSAASGRIALTLSAAGGLSCAADPQWVARQSAAALMTALSEALQEARADLVRTTASNASTAGTGTASGTTGDSAPARLDRLLDEAFALLKNPLAALEGS